MFSPRQKIRFSHDGSHYDFSQNQDKSLLQALGGRQSADRKKSDTQKDSDELSQTGYYSSVSNIKSGRDNNSPCESKDCKMLKKSKKGDFFNNCFLVNF